MEKIKKLKNKVKKLDKLEKDLKLVIEKSDIEWEQHFDNCWTIGEDSLLIDIERTIDNEREFTLEEIAELEKMEKK